MLRTLASVIAVLALSSPALGDELRAVTRLLPFEVRVYINAMASEAGLVESTLRTTIQFQLRQKSIPVEDTAPSTLYLKVSAISAFDDDQPVGPHIVYVVDLSVADSVLPSRAIWEFMYGVEPCDLANPGPACDAHAVMADIGEKNHFTADTWITDNVFGIVPRREFVNTVNGATQTLVKRFIKDYLAANPKE